jgi:hypothetical protein
VLRVVPNGGSVTDDGSREAVTPALFLANHVYGADGQPIEALPQLSEHDAVFTVPRPGRVGARAFEHFIWPAYPTGARITVHDVDAPTRAPVVLEALSAEPRIFRVHDLLSGAEAAELVRTAQAESNPYRIGAPGGDGDGWRSRQARRTSEVGWDFASALATRVRRRVFQLLRTRGVTFDHFSDHMYEGIQVRNANSAGVRVHATYARRPQLHDSPEGADGVVTIALFYQPAPTARRAVHFESWRSA